MDATFWLMMSLNCRLPDVSLGTGQEWLSAGFAFPNIPGILGEAGVTQGPWSPRAGALSRVTLEYFCAIHLFLREGRD